jgi:hypothetical protein
MDRILTEWTVIVIGFILIGYVAKGFIPIRFMFHTNTFHTAMFCLGTCVSERGRAGAWCGESPPQSVQQVWREGLYRRGIIL